MRTAERPRFSPESKRVVVPKAFGTPQNDRFRSGQGESHPGRIFSCSKGPDPNPRQQERRIRAQGPHRIATTRIDSGLSSAKLFSRMSCSPESGRAPRGPSPRPFRKWPPGPPIAFGGKLTEFGIEPPGLRRKCRPDGCGGGALGNSSLSE